MRSSFAATAVFFFAGTASAAPVVTITYPTPGVAYGDSVYVLATTSSPYTMKNVTASVGSATATSSGSSFSAALSTADLPYGTYTLTVTGTDVLGGVGSATVPVLIDRPPTASLTAPVDDATVGVTTPLTATCTDDRPGCTLSAKIDTTEIASGTGSISTTVSLAAWLGRAVTIRLEAQDSHGSPSKSVEVRVFVANTVPPPVPGLTAVAALPGPVLDFDGAKALYTNVGSTSAFIRDLSTKADTTIYTGVEHIKDARLLASKYAAFSTTDGKAWEWNGTAATVQGDSFDVGGSLIAFGLGCKSRMGSCYSVPIRNPATSSTPSVMNSYWNFFGYAGASNDDFVYANSMPGGGGTGEIHRWRAGTDTNLGSHGGVDNLLTDGVNIVWVGGFTSKALWRFGDTTPLLEPVSYYDCFPKVAGGWILFTKRKTGTGPGEVWRRSPTGSLEQINVFASDSVGVALAPTGEVLYTNSSKSYLANNGSTLPREIPTVGRPLFVAGSWYLIDYNNIYRVDGGSSPADGGTSDATTTDSGADTSAADSSADTSIADSSFDTLAADGSLPDTFIADSKAADTSVADDSSGDGSLDDASMSDSGAPMPDAAVTDGEAAPTIAATDEATGCTHAPRGGSNAGALLLAVMAGLRLRRRPSPRP